MNHLQPYQLIQSDLLISYLEVTSAKNCQVYVCVRFFRRLKQKKLKTSTQICKWPTVDGRNTANHLPCTSSQIMIFHQPGFSWNKKISLPKSYLFGVKTRVRSRANLTQYETLQIMGYLQYRLVQAFWTINSIWITIMVSSSHFCILRCSRMPSGHHYQLQTTNGVYSYSL